MARAGRKPKGANGVAAADERVVWKGPPWLQAHLVPLDSVRDDPDNLNTHGEDSIAGIVAAYGRYGQQKNVVCDAAGVVRAGNGQLEAARRLGWTHLAVGTSDLTGSDLIGFAVADNESARPAYFDQVRLLERLRALQSEDYPVEDTGFDAERIDRIADDLARARLQAGPPDGGGSGGAGPAAPPSPEEQAAARQTLADRFGVPPFSVLDARQGYWQDRKRLWLSLGIQSELGRGGNMLDGGHSDQSINIDFYARKRALESELGRSMTTDEARNILVERGEIVHVDRSKNAAASPGRPMPAMQMTDGKTVRGDAKGGGGGRPGEYNGRAKKGTYNDRQWIKDKGLTGLAQDAHVTPALAEARGRRATTASGNAGAETGSP